MTANKKKETFAELEPLVASLEGYLLNTRRVAAEEKDSTKAALDACCRVLITCPPELGTPLKPGKIHKEILGDLNNCEGLGIPEVRACRLWLDCLCNGGEEEYAGCFEVLSREQLWGPVRALVLRALAFYGRRASLLDLLPAKGPVSLPTADSCLEAYVHQAFDPKLSTDIEMATDIPLPPECLEAWGRLIRTELQLALGEGQTETHVALDETIAFSCGDGTEGYKFKEGMRIAARAVLAKVRWDLGQRCADRAAMKHPALKVIPRWETRYYEGLIRWQEGDEDAAANLLRDSIALNEHQASNRLALAALVSPRSPEEALQVLSPQRDSLEMCVSSAALLARLQRRDDALEILGLEACSDFFHEPLRFSWPRIRERYRKRENALRMALIEKSGDWKAADKEWMRAGDLINDDDLHRARRLFSANTFLGQQEGLSQWNKNLLRQVRKRLEYELRPAKLTGDALFYRAVTVMEDDHDQASRDLTTLLNERSWVESEVRAGCGRMVFVGDCLARLGCFAEAFEAYEIARARCGVPCDERLALLSAAKLVGTDAANSEIVEAVPEKSAPDNPWQLLVLAIGSVIRKDNEEAYARADEAAKKGAPESLCDILKNLASDPTNRKTMSEERLAELPLPERAKAAVRLLMGSRSEAERIRSFAETAGGAWIDFCPVDTRQIAWKLSAAYCSEGDWHNAGKLAGQLERIGEFWAEESALALRLRHALNLAMRGDLKAAKKALDDLA